jgi:hypothetical protein
LKKYVSGFKLVTPSLKYPAKTLAHRIVRLGKTREDMQEKQTKRIASTELWRGVTVVGD